MIIHLRVILFQFIWGRVYNTGSISAKIVIAIAQILNINPFFLTGEADERGECTDEILRSFLTAKGYGDLVEEPAKPARKTRARKAPAPSTDEIPATVEETPAPVVDELPVPAVKSSLPVVQNIIPDPMPIKHDDEMTEEEATVLLHSLFIKAKYSPTSRYDLLKTKKLLAYDVSEKENSQLYDTEMTEEESTLLLHSLFIQAKYSTPAKTSLRRVRGKLANDYIF